MIVKEWVGGRSGLHYRVPSIKRERERNVAPRKRSEDHLKGIKVLSHPAFPVEELSKYLAEEQNDGDD